MSDQESGESGDPPGVSPNDRVLAFPDLDALPRRRSRLARDLPIDPAGERREALAVWMKEQFERIEEEHLRRVEILRTVGEHPSPVFSGMVKKFGALGIPKALCAKLMGVSAVIIENYYQDDYDIGAAEILSSVAANMVRIGTSTTDPNAAKVGMDILARRGGNEWKPPSQKLEVADDRDKVPVIDSSKLTFEDRQQLRQIVERAMARSADGEAESTGVVPSRDGITHGA